MPIPPRSGLFGYDSRSEVRESDLSAVSFFADDISRQQFEGSNGEPS